MKESRKVLIVCSPNPVLENQIAELGFRPVIVPDISFVPELIEDVSYLILCGLPEHTDHYCLAILRHARCLDFKIINAIPGSPGGEYEKGDRFVSLEGGYERLLSCLGRKTAFA